MGYWNMQPEKDENMTLIKTNTVLIRRPTCPPGHWTDKFVPFICFSGLFLNDYGFEIGKKFDIYAGTNKLLLKATGFKYENPKYKKKEACE